MKNFLTSLIFCISLYTQTTVGCPENVYSKLTEAENLSQNSKVQCLWMPVDQPKHTTLIAHGFNIKPEKMAQLIEHYHSLKSNVLLTALEGHHSQSMDIGHLSGTWFQQIDHCTAKMNKKSPSTPKNFVGFSLGGVLGARLIQEHPNTFANAELFAPALAIRRFPLLIKYLWEGLIFPTINEIGYTVHKFIPARSYQEIFHIQDNFQNNIHKMPAQSPTNVQIYLHPSDPVISWNSTHNLIQQHKALRNWKIQDIRELGHKKHRTQSLIKHMIIDEKTLGKENWLKITKQLSSNIKKIIFFNSSPWSDDLSQN